VQFVEQVRPEDSPMPQGVEDIDTVIERRERDPSTRAAMSATRQRLSSRIEDRVGGIAAMRLRKGWTQKQLASVLTTSQSHIARIENGRDNVLLATANDLARVLDTTLDEVNQALGFPRKSV
jgi:DNA-binding XRE family transcriptional regulator